MARIKVMSPALASQIAAGEVVERPASAVKELVENAVDAGATRVDVEIDGGGVTRILVSDDGRGMDREDAALAVERHATSKLFQIDDLARVVTYGFRGEALPSIASVSRLSLRTRSSGEDAGTLVTVEGTAAPEVRTTGAPVGTTVEVRDLFFNVVARRKFLRAASTESGHVTDVVEAEALARPDLTFTLTRDGRRVREWLRVESRAERVREMFGEGLATCEGERGPLRIEAFLSRPETARTGAGGLRLLVNSRPVRDRAILHTIAQAYGSILERGRYPRGVLFLDLPPQLVDVNVHPQKGEVRFADGRAVTDAVYSVLSTGLARAFSLPSPARSPWARPGAPAGGAQALAVRGTATPAADASPPAPGEGTDERVASAPDGAGSLDGAPGALVAHDAASGAAQGYDAARQRGGAAGPDDRAQEATVGVDGSGAARGARAEVPSAEDASPIQPGPAMRWASLRFIAQVRQTYLVCEGHDGLYVIDQHAAAERVNFDRLRKQYRSRAVPAQALLFPLTLQVSPSEAEIVEHEAEAFSALGMDLRVRGADHVSVHSVPKLLSRASPERLVRDLLTEVSRSGARAFSDAVDLAIATMACHGSIRAGDKLSDTEASALLGSLDFADFAGHCPHGRPVVAVTSWSELERKVGRR